MKTIWDLLAQGEIVAHDKEMGLIVLWNTNETLRIFRVEEKSWREYRESSPSHTVGMYAHYFVEVEVKTVDLSVNLSQNEKRALMVTQAEDWLKEDGT